MEGIVRGNSFFDKNKVSNPPPVLFADSDLFQMKGNNEGFSNEIKFLIGVHYKNEPDEPKCIAVVRTTFNKGSFMYDREDTKKLPLGELVKIKGGKEAMKKFGASLPDNIKKQFID